MKVIAFIVAISVAALTVSDASALSALCRQAASLGGPCGCVASEQLFGHSDRGLWAVSSWLAKFPRTSPAPGTAAVWPGRHVEAVVGVNGDGTVTTNGPYGVRRVSQRGLVFVDPGGHGGSPQPTFARQEAPQRHYAAVRHTRVVHYAARRNVHRVYAQAYHHRAHYAYNGRRGQQTTEVNYYMGYGS
jgi:hypothetical protein